MRGNYSEPKSNYSQPDTPGEFLAAHYDASPEKPYNSPVPPVEETSRVSESESLDEQVERTLGFD